MRGVQGSERRQDQGWKAPATDWMSVDRFVDQGLSPGALQGLDIGQ